MLRKSGLILIDKPDGMTSHDVVNYIRRRLDTKRVGHTGTLDPLATGLLVMLIGRGTLLSSWLTGMNKRYAARFVFGAVTDTYDIDGEIISTSNPGMITDDDFEKILVKYRGEIEQIIPPYSAVKRAGKTMHKLARNGKEYNAGLKAVEINKLEIIDFNWPEVVVDIGCSSGTYIRSLAHQMGQELGCGGYLKALRRLEVGPFSVSEAETLENLCKSSEPEKNIRPLRDAMPVFPSLHIKSEHCNDVSGGRPLAKKFFKENEYKGDGEELSLLLDQDDNLLALARMNVGWHVIDSLDPTQIIGSYVRVIDEGNTRTN